MTQPVKRGPGRPRKSPAKTPAKKPAAPAPEEDLIGGEEPEAPAAPEKVSIDIAEIYGGVSSNWLATMFGHDKNTIKKKLAKANIEIVGRRNGGPLYRLADAAPYLVKPQVDLVEYIKGLRPNDLPPMLNDAYWSAMLKRQKWEENAKDLWRSEDVLEVLGDLNFQVRNTVNLWVEEVDRVDALSQKQRDVITKRADDLLSLFYKTLVELPAKRSTKASLAEEGAMPEGTHPDEVEAAE